MKTLTIQTIEFKRTQYSPWEAGLMINQSDSVIDMDGRVITVVWSWVPRDAGLFTTTGEGGADYHMSNPTNEGREIALMALRGEMSVEFALSECFNESRSLRLSCSCGAPSASGSVDPDTAKQLSQVWREKHPAPEHRTHVEYLMPQKAQTKIEGGK